MFDFRCKMFPSKLSLIFLCLNCCFLIQSIGCYEDGDEADSEGDSKAKEEKESREMEAFMKLMIKSSQKNLKRMLETVDIGAITSTKCNASWHRFMADNELSPEKFSTIMEDYKSGNHEKIIKLVRPEQCLISDNGKFCQLDHVTNLTMRSKARTFDLTYALCYPRGCSDSELNDILRSLTETYKGSMFQVKLNVVKCITSVENVTKMEIDTAQKLLAKISGGANQTLDLSKFKLPGSFSMEPSYLPPSFKISSSDSLPSLPINLPDDMPMFSLEDFGISRPPPPIEPSKPSVPQPSFHFPTPPPTSSPESPRPEMMSEALTTPSPMSSTPIPLFKWPEKQADESSQPNPLRYPDIYYSDELPDSYKSSQLTTSTPSPVKLSERFDKTRLLKMIPGLIVQEDDD